jgi:hypothetical protein
MVFLFFSRGNAMRFVLFCLLFHLASLLFSGYFCSFVAKLGLFPRMSLLLQTIIASPAPLLPKFAAAAPRQKAVRETTSSAVRAFVLTCEQSVTYKYCPG